VTTFTVVVTVYTEGELSDQLPRAVQAHPVVIKAQLMFEGGENVLCHHVVPAAALDRHAAGDLRASISCR
jgi:hypothetical protein